MKEENDQKHQEAKIALERNFFEEGMELEDAIEDKKRFNQDNCNVKNSKV